MKNFLINLSVVTAIAGIVSYLVSGRFPAVDFELASYLCIYFSVMTAISHYIITRPEAQTNNSKFIFRFMSVTVIKLFLSIVILTGYAFLNPESAVPFIILFAGNYFLFTTFEVASLMQYFKRKK